MEAVVKSSEPMAKPFDFKALGKRLLAGAVKPAAPIVIDWTSESCAMHSNAIVKMVGAVLVGAKPVIMAEIEKL